ncbi:MAG TPA: DNA-3-methyladenine glycosylase [Cyclobacteriaceae bacterium]|nr:DNA-3-methyladenine glycosylase [Cyclobacteriaceae bacterium]
MGQKLQKEFYLRANVLEIARDLLGKTLVTKIGNNITSGIIVETEAYRPDDRASHAYLRKKTKRNSVMFCEGGIAYVFINYGIHYLFNVVTNLEGEPDAILVRGLEPVSGIETMMARRNKSVPARITSGPGALSQAMGIDLKLNGINLRGNTVWIEDNKSLNSNKMDIISSTRIGIDYAGKHASLPWRFYIRDNVWISKT